MPVNVPDKLPAIQRLAEENIFVMTETRARTQDIRPLKIGVVNLMPTKEVTETQLLRLLGNTALQVDVTFIKMATHISKNASEDHMENFYRTFAECRGEKFDGLIITGAPVEQMEFEEVNYWNELQSIMKWAQKHVFSTLYICWAAQAGLYYRYGIEKYPLPEKCSGVFAHRIVSPRSMLMRGFDEVFNAPHSRHTEVRLQDVEKVPELQVLAVSDEAGLFAAKSTDNKHIFITGHVEYDRDTLKLEYLRDIGKGMKIDPPAHYFPGDDPQREPAFTWRAHANLLFANWLNYYVYQETPYDLASIGNA